MSTGEERGPFWERGWFKGVVAVVGLVAAIWALIGAPRLWDVVAGAFSTDPPVSYTEVVLDTSSAMGEEFAGNGETKLDAATRAIRQAVGELDNEGLALRRTSSECGGSSELVVDFGSDQADEVAGTAQEQQPSGSPNLTSAVIAALDDFKTPERVDGPPSTKRVLVFTAGVDECFEGDAAEKIGAELEGAEISKSSSLTLIALKSSDQDLRRLEELERALRGYAYVESRTPETVDELDEAVENVVEVDDQAEKQLEETEEDEVEKTVSG
ncbi:MAG TPA: vWA domain-containing protein [Solirubrobacterales bacterium]|nr:vWA domain-containing protein [Solirubrobacterales bacterium]